jgi:hypothetical protein
MSQHHDTIIRWLIEQGAEAVRIERVGRLGHPRVVFVWRGVQLSYAIAGTPGNDWTADRAMITQLRHLLGLAGGEKRVGERRKRRRVPKEGGRVKRSSGRARGIYGYVEFEPGGAVATLGDVWPGGGA